MPTANDIVPAPPEWHPHDDPNYDSILSTACALEWDRLRTGTSCDRLAFIVDPRDVHKKLYTPLAPPSYKEYAGTFRGTPGTSLVAREVNAIRISDGKPKPFCLASKVEAVAIKYRGCANMLFNNATAESPRTFFRKVIQIFYVFGLMHPFLDGNGHIQRLIFAACIFERHDLELLPSWTIHPRPYDEEVALAFEQSNAKAIFEKLSALLSVHVRGAS